MNRWAAVAERGSEIPCSCALGSEAFQTCCGFHQHAIHGEALVASQATLVGSPNNHVEELLSHLELFQALTILRERRAIKVRLDNADAYEPALRR